MTPPPAMPAPARRFVIIGLPRSGTTYLMTLLNSHREVFCSGEQFNPYAIVGISDKDNDPGAVLARDAAPIRFMEAFFAQAEAQGTPRVGFKFMIGHNARVMDAIAERPELTLVYVHRANRLAQASSLIKATNARKWAQHRPDDHLQARIAATPQQISQRWHEFATFDRLFAPWFDALPHRRMRVEYREMFAPGFNARLCDFLGIAADPKMKSPLLKQSANAVLDRFERPAPIRRYFTRLGLAAWLEPEL